MVFMKFRFLYVESSYVFFSFSIQRILLGVWSSIVAKQTENRILLHSNLFLLFHFPLFLFIPRAKDFLFNHHFISNYRRENVIGRDCIRMQGMRYLTTCWLTVASLWMLMSPTFVPKIYFLTSFQKYYYSGVQNDLPNQEKDIRYIQKCSYSCYSAVCLHLSIELLVRTFQLFANAICLESTSLYLFLSAVCLQCFIFVDKH